MVILLTENCWASCQEYSSTQIPVHFFFLGTFVIWELRRDDAPAGIHPAQAPARRPLVPDMLPDNIVNLKYKVSEPTSSVLLKSSKVRSRRRCRVQCVPVLYWRRLTAHLINYWNLRRVAVRPYSCTAPLIRVQLCTHSCTRGTRVLTAAGSMVLVSVRFYKQDIDFP